MNCVIRPATAKDLEALIQLGRQTFIETYKGMGQERPEGLEELYGQETFNVAKLTPLLSLYYLLEVSKTAVGFMKLESGEPPACIPDRHSLQLAQAYLLKKNQGQGFGRALIDEAVKIARAKGHKSLWAGVYDQNTPALVFYLKMGFQQMGSKDWKFKRGDMDYTDTDLVLYLPL